MKTRLATIYWDDVIGETVFDETKDFKNILSDKDWCVEAMDIQTDIFHWCKTVCDKAHKNFKEWHSEVHKKE